MSPLESGAWIVLQEAGKGLLVLSAAAITALALRRRPAAWRHQVWALALLALLALPALSVLLPAWSPAGIPSFNSAAAATLERSETQAIPAKAVAGWTSSPSATEIPSAPELSSKRSLALGFNWGWLAWIWLGGFAALGLRLLSQSIALRRLLRSGVQWQQPDVQQLLDEQRHIAGARKPVQLRISPKVPVPMAFGFMRHQILLPSEAQGWSRRRLAVVLLHECSHLARQDSLFNLAGELSALLHWFNPLLWMALRRMRLESERACDDRVLQSGVQPRLYARYLLDCVQGMRAAATWTAIPAAMADRSGLKRRLQSILDQGTPRQARMRPPWRIAIGLAALLMLPLASLHLWHVPEASAADRSPPGRFASLQQLVDSLDDPDPQVRKRIAWSLGEREDRRAVPRLIEALQDPDPEVRAMVCWALGEIKDLAALRPLRQALKDPDAKDREMAAMALGELEDARAVPALTELFADPAGDVRAAAVWALGEIGGRQAWQQIIAALADPAVAVRLQAVEVLGQRRVRSGLPALLKSLFDKDPSVRTRSAHSLGLIRDPQALPALLASLQDPDPGLRRESATALGRIGDPRSVDPLIRTLRDSDAQVRAQAVWALDEISER